MSDDKEPLWIAVARELLTTLAREIGELLPGLVLRWARRRFGIDPIDTPTAEDDHEQNH